MSGLLAVAQVYPHALSFTYDMFMHTAWTASDGYGLGPKEQPACHLWSCKYFILYQVISINLALFLFTLFRTVMPMCGSMLDLSGNPLL